MPNKSKEYKTVSAIILAAGNSVRMGSPKFMLRFDETHNFLEKIVEGYKSFGCKEIKIVLNQSGANILKQEGSKDIDIKQIVVNTNPEKERLLSIQIGLKALTNPKLIFIHPVDNPFVDLDILKLLVNSSKNCDYQIPVYRGKGGHPILISKKVIDEICHTSNMNINFKVFLESFLKFRVNVNNPAVLSNINTKVDYLDFQQEIFTPKS
jgi:molybdenum cofactor cytidylyltransferase